MQCIVISFHMSHRLIILPILICLAPFINAFCFADPVSPGYIEELKTKSTRANGVEKVDLLNKIAYNLYYQNPDSCIVYANRSVALAEAIDYPEGLSEAQRLMGIGFKANNNEKEAISWLFKGLQTAESTGYHQGIGDNLNSIGLYFSYVEDYNQSIRFFQRSIDHQIKAANKQREGIVHANLGRAYLKQNNFEKALAHFSISEQIIDSIGDDRWRAMIFGQLGEYCIITGNISDGTEYSLKALELGEKTHQIFHVRKAWQNLSDIYYLEHKLDLALSAAGQAMELSEKIGFIPYLTEACESIYKIHKALDNHVEALKYSERMHMYKDRHRSSQISSEAGLYRFRKELEQKELENERLRKQNQNQEAINEARENLINRQAFIVVGSFVILLVVSGAAIILFRLRESEREANRRLLGSNKELEDQKEELTATLQMVEHLNAQLQAQNNALNQSAIVSLTDLNGNIISVNDNFCRVSGYEYEELIGVNKRIVKSEEHDREFFKTMWETILKGESWRGEIKNQKKDGNHFWCDTAIAPVLDDNGNPKQFFAIQFEITDRKNSLNQLAAKSHELEELNKLKDKLLSIVSHDFRSPLNSLKGTLQLLIDGIVDEEEFKILTRDLVDKLDHTSNLLDNLLNWARSQMQGTKAYPKYIDLRSITDECIVLLDAVASKKLIRIKNYIDEPVNVYADYEMIKLIIRNLISNGIKFSNPRSEIYLNTDKIDDEIIFSVEDQGIGMSDEEQDKLFKHENFSKYGTSNEKGMGIGLLLCKDFVERNGGKIWFESQRERGSTFYISLPAKQPEMAEYPA